MIVVLLEDERTNIKYNRVIKKNHKQYKLNDLILMKVKIFDNLSNKYIKERVLLRIVELYRPLNIAYAKIEKQ